jgi:Nucleotide modification associated domain 2
MQHDARTDRVLISDHFIYFGTAAPIVPAAILEEIGFRNAIGHRVYSLTGAQPLIAWLNASFGNKINHVLGDPFQFMRSGARYSRQTDRII